MYEYVKALVKHKKPNVKFEELDVSKVAVRSMMTIYDEVYVQLRHPSLTGIQTLIFSDIEDKVSSQLGTVTFEAWLAANGNDTLPTTPGVPVVESNSPLAKDAWQAGYKLDLCVPSGSPLNEAIDSDKTDIWMTRPDTDYRDVQAHCLVTVNGLVHRLDADDQGAYIKDGGTSFRKAKKAITGLISFKTVGKVHTATINPEDVYHIDPTKHYSSSVYIKVPFDTTNKVMGIVIGGYLHLCPNDVRVIGDNAIRVNMKRLPILERYMVSRYLIDQSSMERFHKVSDTNLTDYDLLEFNSNECMLELLTLSQSFIVGIEVDHLTMTRHATGRTGLPGRFYYDEPPMYPLMTELGLLPSYMSEEEAGIWVVRIDNNLRQNRFMNTTDFSPQVKVDEKRVSSEAQSFSKGDLIKWTHSTVSIKVPT